MNVGQLFILFGLKNDDASFKKGLKQLAALKVAASVIHGAIIGVGEKFVEMALGAAAAGTHILGTAAGLGMSAESFQKWSYVAKQAGGDATQVARGIGMLERNLHAFAEGRGSHAFKDAMHHIGVSQQQAQKAMVGKDGINEAIFLVSDGYKRLGINVRSSAINQAIAGARNREFLQDLSKGSEFLRAQFKHLEDMGGVVSEDKLQNLKKFQNSLDDVKTSFNGLVMTVVGGLGPQFSKLLDGITKWIGKNREIITDVLEIAFKVVAKGLEILVKTMMMFVNIIKGLKDGEFGAVLVFSLILGLVLAIAGALITVLYPAIVAIGGAIFAAMLPLLPWTLLLGAIIALVILVAKHWDQVKAGAVAAGKAIWGVVQSIGDGFVAIGQAIFGVFIRIKDIALGVVADVVRGFIKGINLIIRALNHLPKVNIGQIGIPDWARHNTAPDDKAGTTSETSRPTSVPGIPATMYRAYQGGSPNQRPYDNITKSVNIAPTTVNIYGVKDADQAGKSFTDAIDAQHRHAFAALGGEQ